VDLQLVAYIAAFGGGLVGAALGGLFVFSLCGIFCIVGVVAALAGSDYDFLGQLAFGPFLGPQVAFVGAVAAAAYAKRTGKLDDGKNILSPLVGLGSSSVLLVGGAFGVLGFAVEKALKSAVSIDSTITSAVVLTDTVALTVVILAAATRLSFGRTGLVASNRGGPGAQIATRWHPTATQAWLPFQSHRLQVATVAVGFGLAAGWLIVSLPESARALGPILLFGFSATTLLLLQIGLSGPVSHHITLPAGLAAVAVLSAGAPSTIALVAAVGVGLFSAFLAELSSRIFHTLGDSHFDPPACAIAVTTSLIVGTQLIFGQI
jgi:hypothetical protein